MHTYAALRKPRPVGCASIGVPPVRLHLDQTAVALHKSLPLIWQTGERRRASPLLSDSRLARHKQPPPSVGSSARIRRHRRGQTRWFALRVESDQVDGGMKDERMETPKFHNVSFFMCIVVLSGFHTHCLISHSVQCVHTDTHVKLTCPARLHACRRTAHLLSNEIRQPMAWLRVPAQWQDVSRCSSAVTGCKRERVHPSEAQCGFTQTG